MKRSAEPNRMSAKRLASLGGAKQYSTITSPRKAIAKSNPEREAKRRKTRRTKHAAYKRSETWREVEQRAGGRCEAAVRLDWFEVEAPSFKPPSWFHLHVLSETWQRCENTSRLQHHHLTYARYGGDELPDDMLVCCPRCHGWLEKVNHPTRKNGRAHV